MRPLPNYGELDCRKGSCRSGRLARLSFHCSGSLRARANGRVIFNLAPNYKNNYSVQASMSIPRQITHNLSLEVGYLLYRGVHHSDVARDELSRNGRVRSDLRSRSMPRLTRTSLKQNTYSSIGSSTYNGLTSSLTKRYSGIFSFRRIIRLVGRSTTLPISIRNLPRSSRRGFIWNGDFGVQHQA